MPLPSLTCAIELRLRIQPVVQIPHSNKLSIKSGTSDTLRRLAARLAARWAERGLQKNDKGAQEERGTKLKGADEQRGTSTTEQSASRQLAPRRTRAAESGGLP
jgi:hypothetical protein